MTVDYLIDTDICVFYFHKRFDLVQKIETVGSDRCHLSEITVAELKFGAEKSNWREEHLLQAEELCKLVKVLAWKMPNA